MRREVTFTILFAALTVAGLALAAGASPQPLLVSAARPQPLLAPTSACPHQGELNGPNAVQVRAMRCLVNFARKGRGLPALAASPVLDRAAAHKSADILRCEEFSHEACGRPFTYWMEHVGYLHGCTGAGENIAWGTGQLGNVRSIFRAWMHSPGHRENILGSFEDVGIGLRVGKLEGKAAARVWAQDFGSQC